MRYNPVFKFAFVCGRYGHASLGHKMLIDKGIELAEKTYVAVGSAQEKGTLRNPFSVETRIDVIKEMYSDIPSQRIIVDGINDLSNELNRSTSWGTYLKNHLIDKFGEFPDLILYGREGQRSSWFEESDLTKTYELLVPRSLVEISGTKIRGLLLTDNRLEWNKYSPKEIHHMYFRLREELMEVPIYKRIFSRLCEEERFDIETFMRIYGEYEEADRLEKLAQLKQMQK